MLRPLLVVLVVLAGLLSSRTAPAQGGGAAPPEAVSTATLEDLVATIQDPVARETLVEQLQALIAARRDATQQPGERDERSVVLEQFRGFFKSLAQQLGDTAVLLVDQVGRLPDRVRGFWRRMQDPNERRVVLQDLLVLAVVLAVAVAAAVGAWWLLRRWRRSRSQTATTTRRHRTVIRLLHAFVRLLFAALPAVVLVAVTVAGIAALPATRSGAALLLALVSAIAVKRVASAAVAALLAPENAMLRLLPFSDEAAPRMARSIDRLLAIAIYGFFALEALAAIEADAELLEPLRSLYGLVLLACGIWVVMRYRNERFVTTAEPAAAASPWRRAVHALGNLWWLAAVAYMIGLYAVWVSQVEGGFAFVAEATVMTLVVLAATALALFVTGWLTGTIEARTREIMFRLPLLEQRVPRYFDALRLVLRIGIWILALGFLLEVWGVDALETFGSPAVRAGFAAVLGVLLVVRIAALVIDLATALTQNFLTRSQEHGALSAKARTLVPLANKAIKLVVVVMAAITVLSQLGVQIGPILAGVGVLGLAVGFGAQTLVKDIITGVFILVEDSVAVGDVVNVAGIGGLVEAVNIRTIVLRDLSGSVHTIPFSSVGTVTNMTKGFSCYVIDAGVAYREDVDEVMQVLRELGEELRQDPKFGPDITKPIEIMGVERFEDSQVVVRARLTTKPIRQWDIGREFNRRMKKAFDDRGIEIPFPHQTIWFGEDKQRSAPPLRIARDTAPPAGAS